MKTIVYKTTFLGVAFLTWTLSANAELPSTITTTDGATYNGVSLIRVEPDGYLVNYQPVKNGMGVAKIKFSRLSADQQKQSGYDPQKAHEFEIALAKGAEDWRQENARMEQNAKIERQSREQNDERQEQLSIQRLAALAQLEQAEANLAQARGGDDYGSSPVWSSLTDGYGAVAIPTVEENDYRHSRNTFNRDQFGHEEFNRDGSHHENSNHQLLSPWPPRGNFNRGFPAK
jgi:hypothetical protein